MVIGLCLPARCGEARLEQPPTKGAPVMAHEVEEVDVVVLGMGPGGEEVAGKLAVAGLEVIGIDERLVGGECPYWGPGGRRSCRRSRVSPGRRTGPTTRPSRRRGCPSR